MKANAWSSDIMSCQLNNFLSLLKQLDEGLSSALLYAKHMP